MLFPYLVIPLALSATGIAQELLDNSIDYCASDIDQNPIDIIKNNSIIDPTIKDDFHCDLPQELSGVPIFTGETVRFDVENESTCTFQGATYRLAQFHFHWGRDNSEGSEHTINGKAYPLEMHMVHINDKYPDQNTAIQYDDAFLVVAVLFDPVRRGGNGPISEVIRGVAGIEEPGAFMNLNTSDLVQVKGGNFFDIEEFCTVPGSLTTPPCTPNVRWVISQKRGTVDNKTLKRFRDLNINAHGSVHDDEDDEDGEESGNEEEDEGHDEENDEEDEEDGDSDEEGQHHNEESGRNFRETQPLAERNVVCSARW